MSRNFHSIQASTALSVDELGNSRIWKPSDVVKVVVVELWWWLIDPCNNSVHSSPSSIIAPPRRLKMSSLSVNPSFLDYQHQNDCLDMIDVTRVNPYIPNGESHACLPLLFWPLLHTQCLNSAVSRGTFRVRKATNNLFNLTREHFCRRLALRDQPHHVSTSNLVRWSYRRWLHAASQHRWKSPPHWTKGVVDRLGKLVGCCSMWSSSTFYRPTHHTFKGYHHSSYLPCSCPPKSSIQHDSYSRIRFMWDQIGHYADRDRVHRSLSGIFCIVFFCLC